MAAGVLLVIFTSWTGLFWIAVALVLYELAVFAIALAAPEPGGPEHERAGESTQRGGTVSPA